MHPWRRIFDQRQNRPTVCRHQCVTDADHDASQCGAHMLHGHAFAEIMAVKRPGIDHLLPVGVDHADLLPVLKIGRFPAAGGDRETRSRHRSFLLRASISRVHRPFGTAIIGIDPQQRQEAAPETCEAKRRSHQAPLLPNWSAS